MAYILKFSVTGDQEAINKTKRVYNEGEKSASASAGKIKDRFRDVFENVTQNATGTFGSIAGGLFKLPGVAGIAAAGVLAAFGGMLTAANKFAEANAANDAASAKFLVTIGKVKSTFSSVVSFIGDNAVSAFNALADAFGVAASQQEILLRQEKAYNDLIVKQVSDTDAYVKKLNELLDADKRLLETGLIRDYFDAFAKGNAQLANQYARNLSQLRTQQKLEQDLAQLQSKGNQQEQSNDRLRTIQEEIKGTLALGKSISDTFERLDKQRREEIAAGIAGMDAALKKSQDVFAAENAINRKKLEDAAEFRRQQEDAAARQIAMQRELGNAIKTQVASQLTSLIFAGEKFETIIKRVLASLAERAFTSFLFKVLGASFGGGGLGGLFGSLFGKAAALPVSLNAPIATAPVARFTPAPLARVNSLNNTNNTSNISNTYPITVIINQRMDESEIRNKLLPMIGKVVRQGGSLPATKVI